MGFYFLAVTVISTCPCPTSLATTTVVRVGRCVFEVCLVNGVHPLEGRGIGEVHLHGHDISRGHSGRLEDSANVLESLFYLRFEIAGDFASGVFATHTRYERSITTRTQQ